MSWHNLLSASVGYVARWRSARPRARRRSYTRRRPSFPVELTVNGRVERPQLDPRTTLLDALREHLGLKQKGLRSGPVRLAPVM